MGVTNRTLPILPIPVLNSDNTKVLLGPQPPVSTPGKIPASGVTFATDVTDHVYQKWNRLEEMIVQELSGSQPMIFKPMVTFFSSKNHCNSKPIAVMGEPVQVSLSLHNTLQIVLPLKDIFLLWKFTNKDGDEFSISNECVETSQTDKYIRTHNLDSVNLRPESVEQLVLSITPLAVGELVIEGICYTMMNAGVQDGNGVTGKQKFNIRGSKLKVKEKMGQQTYGEDKRLQITVVPSAPCLQVMINFL